MKTEQNTGQPPVPQNGKTPIAPWTALGRLAQGGLPSPETIAAHTVPPPPKPEPLAYDIKEAAARLNTSTKTVRRWLILGKLTCCRELRKILIPREQIDNFYKRTCDKPNLGV